MHERILSEALNSLRAPLAVFDRGGACVFSNGAFRDLLHLPTQESAIPVLPVLCPEWKTALEQDTDLSTEIFCGTGNSWVVRLAVRQFGDGYVLLRVNHGQSADRELLESFQAQRLETLGLLAGGIAHDFNNVLAGILGHISYLKTILPGSGPHLESIRSIDDGCKKASQMTQQILKFSKMDTADVGQVGFNDLIVRTVALLRRAISPEFNIVTEVPEKPLVVIAAEAKLAQIVANLMINSRDALRPNGTIRVKLSQVDDTAILNSVFKHHERGAACYALLEVIDDGHGIPKEVQTRMFDPYFSTKADKGTGLGLTTVLKIVRELGGAIDVKSTENEGTAIAVYVPLVESVIAPEAPARSGDASQMTLPRGTEVVLVIDDEYPVRNVIALGLSHLGYQVITASSGPEGIALYEASQDRIALVLVDMLMPKLSGNEVFFRLQALNSKVKVLLMSGYTSEELVSEVLEHGGRGFLQKPFSIEDLARKVRRCIDE